MSRSVSNTTKKAMFARETGEVFLMLITITQADLTGPLYFCNNSSDIVSRAQTYTAYPFKFTLPTDDDQSSPVAKVTIDHVNRDIADALRSMTSPAIFKIEVIRASAPDTVEITYDMFKLSNVQGDLFSITGQLTLEDIMTEPFPYRTFDPAKFRGLFT